MSLVTTAQIMDATGDKLNTFFASTVYVPITGNVAFDEALQKGFNKYWKVTPFKFIPGDEYKKLYKANEKDRKHEPGNPKSFLFQWSSNWIQITDVCHADTYFYGDENLSESQWVDGTDYFAKSKTFDNIKYRIDYIIKAMNDLILLTKEQNLAFNQFNAISSVINKNTNILQYKTLLVNIDFKYGNKKVYKEEAFENYSYKVKFVSDAEFKAALKSEQADVVCLVPVYWQGHTGMQAIIYVYEPATRNTIYMDFCEKFNKFNPENVAKLKAAINK
jgi:hypothetical protein